MKPIGDELVQDTDEERLHSTWRGVRSRMARRRRAPARLSAAVAVGLAATATLVAWAAAEPAPGPLHHASGATLHTAESVAEPRALRLEDRSTIELATGARVEPRHNDAARLELALVRGRARFDVTPNGPREWVIDAGLATIRVLGTAFVVDRGEAMVVVEVERGRVRVESDTLADGGRVLSAGERLEIQRPVVTATAEGAEPEPVEPAVAIPPTEPESGEPSSRAPSAPEPPEPVAAERPPGADPSELLRAADIARREGRAADAREPLEAILLDHPDHPEAPLAAITLARLQLGPLDDPSGALRSLRLARRLGVPRLFDAEVCSSLALVLDATGDPEEARREASRCLARHGAPPHAERLHQLAEAP